MNVIKRGSKSKTGIYTSRAYPSGTWLSIAIIPPEEHKAPVYCQLPGRECGQVQTK